MRQVIPWLLWQQADGASDTGSDDVTTPRLLRIATINMADAAVVTMAKSAMRCALSPRPARLMKNEAMRDYRRLLHVAVALYR